MSRGTRSAQPANAEQLPKKQVHNKTPNVTLRNGRIHSGRCIRRAAGSEFSAVRKPGAGQVKVLSRRARKVIVVIGAGGSPNLYLPVPVEAGSSVGKISRPDEDPAGIPP